MSDNNQNQQNQGQNQGGGKDKGGGQQKQQTNGLSLVQNFSAGMPEMGKFLLQSASNAIGFFFATVVSAGAYKAGSCIVERVAGKKQPEVFASLPPARQQGQHNNGQSLPVSGGGNSSNTPITQHPMSTLNELLKQVQGDPAMAAKVLAVTTQRLSQSETAKVEPPSNVVEAVVTLTSAQEIPPAPIVEVSASTPPPSKGSNNSSGKGNKR